MPPALAARLAAIVPGPDVPGPDVPGPGVPAASARAGRRVRLPLLLALVALLGACAITPPRDIDDVCSIFEEKRGWHKVATKAQKKWGSSMHIPLAFMRQESGFRHKARPPRRYLLGLIPWRRPSSAYGYAQAIDGTWREYIDATGEYWRVRHDFADATDFIHWYIGEAGRRNGIPGSDAFSLYISYHEGPTGYARGSYHDKPWLQKVATGVQLRSQRYAAQYEGCRESLERGFFARLLGR